MNESNMITFLSFVGALVMVFWAAVGFAFSMRWGTTGLAYLWRNKDRLTRLVEADIHRNTRKDVHANAVAEI